jgi:hypothetical protein
VKGSTMVLGELRFHFSFCLRWACKTEGICGRRVTESLEELRNVVQV